MLYFAYGSNMQTARLKEPSRAPSARPLCIAKLVGSRFCFHKRSKDGSAKGNALETGDASDVTWGVVFEIDQRDKSALDKAEGLGNGYLERTTIVVDKDGGGHEVFAYVAAPKAIDDRLSPYSWYKRFVVDGAREHKLPTDYIARIEAAPSIEDPDKERDAKNRAINCPK